MGIDNGGAAYPRPTSTLPYNNEVVWEQDGMTLLDYFAGQALAGDWAAQSAELGEFVDAIPDKNLENRAKVYYRQAAAMIAEKRRRESCPSN